jgi:hypothetical protein
MSRIHSLLKKRRPAAALAVGVLAASALLPVSAAAFFQQTKLEGAVGTDIGGVWLSVHQIMPEFRIQYPKPAEGRPAIPLEVGPIPGDLEPITGKNPAGVSVVGCTDASFCGEHGIVPGDIVIKVNAAEITDVASWKKALENLPPNVLLSVRRPAIKMTTARLLKIRYKAEGRETDEGSVAQESVDVRLLDVKLPFQDQLDATRHSHAFFQPTPEQLEQVAKGWTTLAESSPPVLVKGSHRFVAEAAFDESLARDLRNTKYAIVMDMEGNPAAGGGKVIDIYGIENVDGKTMEGSYVTVTIASAPFPINIEFKGRFKMYRVADWSDEDDRLRREAASAKAKEDLSKVKTLPDVPPPGTAKPSAEPEKKTLGDK